MRYVRLAALALLLCSSLTAQALPTYSVLPLPIVGPSYAQPYAINNAGIVVGRVPFVSWDYRAFSSDGATMTDLAAVSGVTLVNANAINNSGQIVGNGGSTGAFLYDNGVATELPTLGGPGGGASGLNDQGWVVGGSQNSYQLTKAYVYKNGAITQLVDLTPTLYSPTSAANAINNAGVIVGTSQDNRGFMGVMWSPTGDITPLGTLGGYDSTPQAINESGQIVGYSRFSSSSPTLGAFIWENGVMTDLGNLGGIGAAANAINELGWVVGGSSYANGHGAGFIWTETDGMVSLDSLLDPAYSGWYITAGVGVNDSGQIAAFATTSPGSTDFFAVILNPIGAEVPLPPTLPLLVFGAAMIGWSTKSRRIARTGRH